MNGFVASIALVFVIALGAARAEDAFTYAVSVEGAPNGAVAETISAQMRLTPSTPPDLAGLGALRRAAARDVKVIEKVLRAEGYYKGRAETRIDRDASGAPQAVFTITAGPLFRITDYRLAYTDEGTDRPATLEALTIETAGDAAGKDLLRVQNELMSALRGQGYPAARPAARYVRLAETPGTAAAVFELESGPRALFGPVRWDGLDRVKEDYAEALTPWDEGDLFSLDELGAYQSALQETGLFSTIDLKVGDPEAGGATPVLASVSERDARTVGAGLSYATNLGPGGRLFWEHRNLRGRAEKLRTTLEAAAVEQSLEAIYTKPMPRRRSTRFASALAEREDNDAFESIGGEVQAGFRRFAGRHWFYSVAAGLQGAQVTDADGDSSNLLASLPFRIAWDDIDDALDPTSGVRASVSLTPFSGVNDGAVFFGLLEAEAAAHRALDENRRFILGLWGRAGGTVGPGTTEIPATERFYAGGGGSVRGYGFQLLSPLNEDGVPIGGRSVVEGGAELRGRIKGNIGAAAFIEGGSAFENAAPSFDEALRLGAGAGLRYHSPVGPIRLDVAFPLDKRQGVDDSVQFYISLGQAF